MLTEEDVLYVAKLANISLSKEELKSFTREMANIINFAHIISNVQTDGFNFDDIHGLRNVFRKDKTVPSSPINEILENAASYENGFFLVKKAKKRMKREY